MLNQVLGFWSPGPLEIIVVLFVFVLIIVIPLAAVIVIVSASQRRKKEIAKLRLEVGKIADELESLRSDSRDNEGNGPSKQSG